MLPAWLPEALVVALGVLLLLWGAWHLVVGAFPRLGSGLYPHALVVLVLVAVHLGALVGLVWGIRWLWRDPDRHWRSLTGGGPGAVLAPLDWLWPWFPTLVVLLGLLLLAARHLSRRNFHLLAAGLLAGAFLGVALHGEPASVQPLPVEQEVDDVVLERGSERFFDPILHRDGSRPDMVTLILMGVALLLGYGWLDRVNLRQTLLPIKVHRIEDVGGNARPDLELLMRECLHRNTPHTPAPFPGGGLVYWQDFVEKQSVNDQHWFTRLAAIAMRAIHPPSGMEICGTVIDSNEGRPGGPVKFGIRVHMVDVYTRQTLMARTFWSDTKLEHAVEQGAYYAAERAMEECGKLPEWAYWREDDALLRREGGSALREYHEGVLRIGEDAGEPSVVEKAREHLQRAAERSPGTALAWLQLAEALEAEGDYVGAIEIYLELISRHPHLLVAKYRMVSVCRSARAWAPQLNDKVKATGELDPWTRLQVALSTRKARRLRRPTLLCREQRWRQRQPLKALFSREPDPLIIWNTGRLQDVLLDIALRCAKQMERAGRWWMPFWCLKSTSERRLFWKTLIWPPRRYRGLYLSTKAARLNVELQRLQRLRKNPRYPMPASWRLRHRWCLFRVRLLDFEARHAMRIRGHWLGVTHYNLACFHALRIGDGVDAEAEARRATFHLSCALRDPEGPFTASTWKWLLRYPELENLHTQDAFQAWGQLALRKPDIRAELQGRPGGWSPGLTGSAPHLAH